MLLVIDVGNTETVLGLVDSATGEVGNHWRLTTGTARTADEFDHMVHSLLARKGFDATTLDRAVLGSVVPSINGRMRAALEGLISGPVFVGHGAVAGLSRDEDDLDLGSDLTELPHELRSGEAWHHDIADDEIDGSPVTAGNVEGIRTVTREDHAIAPRLQDPPDEPADPILELRRTELLQFTRIPTK